MHRYFWSIVGFLIFMGASPAQAQDDAMARYEAAMQAADKALDRDRERTAPNHLDDAEAALAEMAGDHPLAQGRILVLRTGVERERQDWDDAFAHIDRAVNLLARGGAEDRELGDAQYSRGYIAYRAEEYVAAEDAFLEAVRAYQTSRGLDDTRRLRANGWYVLARHRNEAFGYANENYVYGQAFVFSNVAAYPDPELQALYPLGEWSEPMMIQIPYTAFVGRTHGFAVAQYELDRNGQPRDVEIIVSYPGRVFDDAARESLRTGRRVAEGRGPNGYVTIFSMVVER